ncbi:hypothetical protein [Argonema antarcticum]|nr:hypothetical protein [Argonema antarcticum A004/B2]
MLGVTIKTLREWDSADRNQAIGTPGGHRRYKQSDVEGRCVT